MHAYEIVNHGWSNSQYFQGCGTAYTEFDHVATGCGTDAKQAYKDAVENIYFSEGSIADRLRLPKRPRGIRAHDRVPAQSDEDCFWYVSIRYLA